MNREENHATRNDSMLRHHLSALTAIGRSAPRCLAILYVAVSSAAVRGGEGCGHCGGSDSHKTCRLVCEKKTIEVPCFASRCEVVCQGGPCKYGCKTCQPVCGSCGKDGCTSCGHDAGCGQGKWFVFQETIPGCPKPYHRKVLLLKKEKKVVTVYRWVVEDLCPKCQATVKPPVVPQSAQIPPPPRIDAEVIRPRVVTARVESR